MRVIVQKYGGSSVATTEKLQRVARKIITTRRSGAAVVVVVSAMGETTDELLSLVQAITPEPDHRELDMLLSTGERITMSLLTMAIQSQGAEALSLTGPQAGIITDNAHTNARIMRVCPGRLQAELEGGKIVIVAGFQGRSGRGEITTLGRGGSDTTAVALAAALGAARCEIYSDVEGVYTADPRLVPAAQLLAEVSYDEMLELARQGASVLNAEAVAFARQRKVEIVARSTFAASRGTRIRGAASLPRSRPLPRVTGIAGRRDLLYACLDSAGGQAPSYASLRRALAACEVVARQSGRQRLEILASCENAADSSAVVTRLRRRFADAISVSSELGSVAAVGPGVGAQPVMRRDAQQALRAAGLAPVMCFTTPAAVVCVVPAAEVETGIKALHQGLIETPQPVPSRVSPAALHPQPASLSYQ